MEPRRPSPEQLLKQVEAEERQRSRGKLKVFLGYASGVGKSFRMFDEGRRRKLRGEDVVVGATQPTAPPEVEELLRGFEIIAPRGHAIDVPAILERRPRVCLIDGLAYSNPAASKHPERWQDVEELLDAGISVVTSLNLQYVKERQPRVEAIRGKVVTESVPEAFLRTADEIEVVDAPSLLPEFAALREIALLLAAEVVDCQLEEYLRRRGIEHVYGTHERILVCITPRSNAELMIRRGRRQADRFHGDLHVVYVEQDELSSADRGTLEGNLACARQAGAQVEILYGEDPIESILMFARQHGITQIFIGHSQQGGRLSRWRINPVERFILEAEGMDVRIFPHDDRPHE